MCYEALTGHLPWPVASTVAVLRAHRDTAPDPLPAMLQLPSEAADMCMACLDKDPQRRPTATVAALILAAAANGHVYLPPVLRPRHRTMTTRRSTASTA
jgi:serine/threonine-protein kinase